MFTLVFDEADMAALNLAIGELPHRLAVPLLAKMNAQLATQVPEQVPEVSPMPTSPDRHA